MHFTQREKAGLFALFSLLFFVFFRPLEALRLDVYNPDSACYADWLYRFFGGSFWNCKYNYYFPGAALLWFPGGCLGYGLSAITGLKPEVWIEPFVGLTTFAAFLAAIAINLSTARLIGGKRAAAVLVCLAAPVLPYASSHTFLAHSAEFFFASATAHALFRRRLPWVLVFGALLTLTRPTGLLVGLLAAGFLLDDFLQNRRQSILLQPRNRLWVGGAVLGAFLLLGRVLFRGYGVVPAKSDTGSFVPQIFANINLTELERFLVGDRNGMLFTGPWWLLLLATGILLLPRLSWAGRAVVVWMAVMAGFCIGWGGNGSQDGWFIFYRYLTSTYLGALFLSAELEEKVGWLWRRVLRVTLVVQVAMVAYMSWMNNYAVPRVWDGLLGYASWGDVIHRHLSLAINTPLPMTLFSWWPGLSRALYRGEHFIAGPRLWILTTMVAIALGALIWTMNSHRNHYENARLRN